MKKIAITLPEFYPNEHQAILQVLERGFDRVHIRKPLSRREDMIHLLNQLPIDSYARIVIHDHLDLALCYPLGGIHLNNRSKDIPNGFKGTVSRSCHSLAEVEKYKKTCDYLFLSPIYDSISKPGYCSKYAKEELEEASAKGIIDAKVYALGGVTEARLAELASIGFGGVAMIGDTWILG